MTTIENKAAQDVQKPSGFTDNSYMIRRKFFKLFGAGFHLYDGSGNVIGYSKQKAFKLKEDIRIYTDDSMTTELLSIKARSMLDFAATYDVVDPRAGGTPVGSLRRKGWKSSLLRDEWLVFNPAGDQVGMIQEDSGALGLLRRFLGGVVNLIAPQCYHVMAGEVPVADLQVDRNPFIYKIYVGFMPELANYIDPRLVLCGSILIAAIEGRQGGV